MSTEDLTLPMGKGATTGRDDTLPQRKGTASDQLGEKIGRHVVLSILGSGGMGIVYAAYDPALDRKIAVKLLREATGEDSTEGRTRMQREAQALARLTHPNVITVHDVGEHLDAVYIAMELVVGGTLNDWQKAKSWREIIAVYIRAARGLAAAHAVGLIHRDFKPENVLVGEDGRVRVTDFGLARLVSKEIESPADPTQSPTSLSSNLTAAGSVMGTPRFMAPEQIEGGVVDARTDQFSWCVALWEALYGEPPFPTSNLALRSASIQTDIPKVPATTKLPRGIAKVLLRGLAPEPDRRWPSIDAMIEGLERVTAPRRTLLIAGAGVAAVGAIAIFALTRSASEPTGPSCDGAGAPIDEVWSAGAKRVVEDSWTKSGLSFARDAYRSVDRSIESWRLRWSEAARENCRATRIIGVQSESVLDLRTACLDRRRDELGILITALQSADAKLVEHASSLVLPDLDTCRDVAMLTATTAAPGDPAKARERQAIEAELTKLDGELVDGVPLDRAKALVEPSQALVKRAVALGWAPLTARARRAQASVESELGKGKQARTTLIAAASSASTAGDLDQLVSIYGDLSVVEARLTSEFALGESWTILAEGTLARLGSRPDAMLRILRDRATVAKGAGRFDDARAAYEAALPLARAKGPGAEIDVDGALGYVLGELGEFKAALAHLDHALALALAELGPNHPKVATINHDRGTVVFRAGNYAEAEVHFRAALAIREKAFGPDELVVAASVQALGSALMARGRLVEARTSFERAIAILEARLGPEHPDFANALNDMGGAYHQAGDYVNELAYGKRTLAIREKALGPDHPDVGQSLVNTAIASKSLGQWDIVEPNYLRAIAIFEKSYGPTNVTTGITHLNFAEALRVRGKLEAAAQEYEKSRAILAAKLGEDHIILAHVHNGVGQLELARGRVVEATALLERAVALREKEPGDAPALAESRFALARALGKTDRARTLATQARDAYRAAGSSFAKQAEEIDLWLR